MRHQNLVSAVFGVSLFSWFIHNDLTYYYYRKLMSCVLLNYFYLFFQWTPNWRNCWFPRWTGMDIWSYPLWKVSRKRSPSSYGFSRVQMTAYYCTTVSWIMAGATLSVWIWFTVDWSSDSISVVVLRTLRRQIRSVGICGTAWGLTDSAERVLFSLTTELSPGDCLEVLLRNWIWKCRFMLAVSSELFSLNYVFTLYYCSAHGSKLKHIFEVICYTYPYSTDL